MKIFAILCITLLLAYASACRAQRANTGANEQASHRPSGYPVIPILDFTGNWTGHENCDGSDSTIITLKISVKDSSSLYISGFYDSAEKVAGKIRGYVVSVSKPGNATPGANGFADGELVLSNNRTELRAYFNQFTGGTVHKCSAILHKEKAR